MLKHSFARKTIVVPVLLILFTISGNCKKKDLLKVENHRVTETIPGNRVSAAYLDIINHSEKDEVLLSVDCDDFETVEFHNMFEENGVMKMVPLDSVPIKAGEKVQFLPGGMHIMLINNKKEIKAGQKIQLNLHFENAGLKTLMSPVKTIQEQVQ